MTHGPEWKDSRVRLGSSTLREKWRQFRLWLHRGLSAGEDSDCILSCESPDEHVEASVHHWHVSVTVVFGHDVHQRLLWLQPVHIHTGAVFPELTWTAVTVTQTLAACCRNACIDILKRIDVVFFLYRARFYLTKSSVSVTFVLFHPFKTVAKQLQTLITRSREIQL